MLDLCGCFIPIEISSAILLQYCDQFTSLTTDIFACGFIDIMVNVYKFVVVSFREKFHQAYSFLYCDQFTSLKTDIFACGFIGIMVKFVQVGGCFIPREISSAILLLYCDQFSSLTTDIFACEFIGIMVKFVQVNQMLSNLSMVLIHLSEFKIILRVKKLFGDMLFGRYIWSPKMYVLV